MDLDSMSPEAISQYGVAMRAENDFDRITDAVRRGGRDLAQQALDSHDRDAVWNTYGGSVFLNFTRIERTTLGVRVVAEDDDERFVREILWKPTEDEIRALLVTAAQWDATRAGQDYIGLWQLTQSGQDSVIDDLLTHYPNYTRDQVYALVQRVHSA